MDTSKYVALGIGSPILGGGAAALLAMVWGMMGAIPLFAIVPAIVAVVLFLYINQMTDIDDLDFAIFIVIAVIVSIFGTLFVTFMPVMAPYILTLAGNLTFATLLWTYIYVMLTAIILHKLGLY